MSKKQVSLRELDFHNIGAWPQNAKIGFCALIASVILLLAWLLFVRDKRTELEGLQRQEADLRSEFETKQGRAANLAAFIEKAGKARRYTDYRQMLAEQKDIDGVLIATPDHTHAAVAMAARRTGAYYGACWRLFVP